MEHLTDYTVGDPARVVSVPGMDVLTLYVGQGALAAVRDGSEAIVIDSHLPRADGRLSAKTRGMLGDFLWLHQTVGLILTGFDADHSSPEGVKQLLAEYTPRWIMYPRYYKDTDTAAQLFRIIDSFELGRRVMGSPLHRCSVRVDSLGSRMLNRLASRFSFELFSPPYEDIDNSNNSSIVLKVTGLGHNGFSYLITGDTEYDRWDRIYNIFGRRLKSDVLAAPHHGSGNAAHSGAVSAIAPDTVLISAGVGNRYGHPHSEAVETYKGVAKSVFSTNASGGVSLCTTKTYSGIKTEMIPTRDGTCSR